MEPPEVTTSSRWRSVLCFAFAAMVLNESAAFADDAAMAGCMDKPADASMPAPPGMNMNEPMPTGMAKGGTMKSDVMHAAGRSKTCMDKQLEQDQQSTPAAPKQ